MFTFGHDESRHSSMRESQVEIITDDDDAKQKWQKILAAHHKKMLFLLLCVIHLIIIQFVFFLRIDGWEDDRKIIFVSVENIQSWIKINIIIILGIKLKFSGVWFKSCFEADSNFNIVEEIFIIFEFAKVLSRNRSDFKDGLYCEDFKSILKYSKINSNKTDGISFHIDYQKKKKRTRKRFLSNKNKIKELTSTSVVALIIKSI